MKKNTDDKISILNSIASSIKKPITEDTDKLSLFFSSSQKSIENKILPTFSTNVSTYIKKVSEYIICIKKYIDKNPNGKEPDKLLDLLENGFKYNTKEKWVFDCFKKIFSNDFKPPLAISIYRGLRFTDVKKDKLFSVQDKSKEDEYKKFLKKYERVQGEGRHTFNSLIADYIEGKDSDWMIFESSISNDDITSFVYRNENVISLSIPKEVSINLINTDFEIIESIQNLNDTDENEIKKIKDFLGEKRKYILTCAQYGPKDSNFNKNINTLLKKFVDLFYGESLNNKSKTELESVFLEVLQVLQGICIFIEKFKGSMISLISKEEDNISGYSCIGQFFILGIKRLKDIMEFCKKTFPIIDTTQRYYFNMVLTLKLEKFQANLEKYESLEFVLKNEDEAKKIVGRLGKKFYNFDSLAGVIRLAEVIRPFAVHEKKPQNFTFLIGYPYIRKDKLEVISDFDSKDGEPIEWFTPKKEKIGMIKENEALHMSKSRIIGNSLILQEKDVALFVDCKKEKPTCNCIVKPDQRVKPSLLHKATLIDVMKENDDVFIVKVVGKDRIEIFHKGEKVLVWSHIFATWEKESNWDPVSLKDSIKEKLYKNIETKDPIISESLEIVSETIYQISQTPGEGASFVIINKPPVPGLPHPEMTVTFPKLGKGKILDTKNLRNVAIADGGTLIDLSSGAFYGRRQWLPHIENGPPFWYKTFTIKRETWNKIFSEKNWLSSSKTDSKETPTVCQVEKDCPALLYHICRFEFLENKEALFIDNPWYWPEWYKILSWGTRHMSSLGMSACFWNEAVVVVVSADSTITVFYEGVEQRPKSIPKVNNEKQIGK